MRIERAFDKYYYLTGDDKSKIGNCAPVDKSIRWDFFNDKKETYILNKPLTFKIDEGRYSGTTGDYQFNSCDFNLFSDKLRKTIEPYLADDDRPVWYPAKVISLNGEELDYSILHFFALKDLLNHEASTFVNGTDLPIKMRYDLEKIDSRLIFATVQTSRLCVHDNVRKEIKKANCTGAYFYKIHTAGRLS